MSNLTNVVSTQNNGGKTMKTKDWTLWNEVTGQIAYDHFCGKTQSEFKDVSGRKLDCILWLISRKAVSVKAQMRSDELAENGSEKYSFILDRINLDQEYNSWNKEDKKFNGEPKKCFSDTTKAFALYRYHQDRINK